MLTHYNVFLKKTATGEIYELPWDTWSFTEELNASKSATVVIDYLALKDVADSYSVDVNVLLKSGLRELWIEKTNDNFTAQKIFYGVLSDVYLTKNNQGVYQYNLACIGYMTLLGRRRTGADKIYTATDAGQIAWGLINDSQGLTGGNLGITQGTITASVSRNAEYKFAKIYDEIVNLSNSRVANGFDFEIDNNKQFQVYYPIKGVTQANYPFDDKNILDWKLQIPLLSTLTNSVYVTGAGINADVTYVQVQSASEIITAYGLLEDVIADRTETDTGVLTDEGDKYLTLHQTPIIALTVTHADDTPDILNYGLGDYLPITISEASMMSEYHRVQKRTVSMDKTLVPIVTVDFL